jgi:hypothetical protein
MPLDGTPNSIPKVSFPMAVLNKINGLATMWWRLRFPPPPPSIQKNRLRRFFFVGATRRELNPRGAGDFRGFGEHGSRRKSDLRLQAQGSPIQLTRRKSRSDFLPSASIFRHQTTQPISALMQLTRRAFSKPCRSSQAQLPHGTTTSGLISSKMSDW